MVYKNRKVVRRVSQDAPIFVGPMMLHGDGKFPTYHHFFSAVNAALNGSQVASNEFLCEGIVTGSDEEQAMVNACKAAFPQSSQLYCMLHCKDNARHYMSSVGIPSNVRQNVLTKLFACNGVAESGDEETMDNRVADTMQYVRQNAGDAAEYIQDRILPKIASNNRLQWRETWLGQHSWSNNNCESVNHVLKLQVCKL